MYSHVYTTRALIPLRTNIITFYIHICIYIYIIFLFFYVYIYILSVQNAPCNSSLAPQTSPLPSISLLPFPSPHRGYSLIVQRQRQPLEVVRVKRDTLSRVFVTLR